MKVYKQTNVYEESIKRIEWLFDEFENIIVSVSGGKDSTVALELTLEVARRRDRLPVNVFWIDQEAEWQHTVDYMREVMYRPEVKPYWLQIPMLLTNCTDHQDGYLHCWDPKAKDKWIHPQDPISIKENTFGTDRFHKLFKKTMEQFFNGEPYCDIAGVRADESLNRFTATTYKPAYKDVTWGKKEPKGYSFYPLYDWSTDDIWTYIAKSKCKYNGIYDLFFRYGVKDGKMRVSNLHHETAYHALFFLQELERKTYDRLVNRLPGIATFGQMNEDVFPKELPEMFASWKDYRDYLLENLVREDLKPIFRRMWQGQDSEAWYKEHVNEVLVNDIDGTKNKNFRSSEVVKKKIAEGRFTKLYE